MIIERDPLCKIEDGFASAINAAKIAKLPHEDITNTEIYVGGKSI
jgi:hypothetical protein